MRITSAKFVKSAIDLENCPQGDFPEFAFIGRSNVGKSSLINLLTNKDGLARVSKTPGRTRELNFFKINDAWTLVDLPGYGFAKVSKSQRDQFNEFVSDYLINRENLLGTFVLIDSRHTPQKIDLQFIQWVVENGLPFVLVFTKIDKTKASTLQKHIDLFKAEMKEWSDGEVIIFTSSASKRLGYKEITSFIERAIEAS